MAYYRTCPNCGCNLDPGERCSDCYPVQDERIKPRMIPITKGKARKREALRNVFCERIAQ